MTSSWDLYCTAVVRFQLDATVVELTPAAPGTCAGVLPPAAAVHVITAFNPGGRTVPRDVNAHAQAALVAEIDALGLPWWPAAGGDFAAGHVEDSVAVAGLDDRATRALGHRYGQDAVFAWTPGAWRLLSCRDTRTATFGWVARTHSAAA